MPTFKRVSTWRQFCQRKMLFRLLSVNFPKTTAATFTFSLRTMVNKSALVLLAEGTEEMEVVIPVDVLRRAGVNVTLTGLETADPVECSRKVKLVPDSNLKEALTKGPYDIVILPGGLGGAKAFSESPAVGALLKEQEETGRTIGAICASPTALKAHGIGLGKSVTSYPSMEPKMVEGNQYKYSQDRVVVDGELITSRGPGTAFEFALAIVKHLLGEEAAKKVAEPLLLK